MIDRNRTQTIRLMGKKYCGGNMDSENVRKGKLQFEHQDW